jgi:hypothetical protein
VPCRSTAAQAGGTCRRYSIVYGHAVIFIATRLATDTITPTLLEQVSGAFVAEDSASAHED